MEPSINEYEAERARRIAENKRVLEAIGVADAARELAAVQAPPAPAPRQAPRPRTPKASLHTERRRSSRVQNGKICYQEESFFKVLEDDGTAMLTQGPRIANTYLRKLTPEQVDRIRELHGVQAMQAYEEGREGGREVQEAVTQALIAARGNRKPVDSGRGVRIQGGRVYDSRHGITCHWCRQKTLDMHVTCSRAECGGGSRLPVTFCAACLANRHGEDQAKAAESGEWVCPPCRGTCGAGCVSCCNCGPCRRKLNLEPTRQLAQFAKSQGFGNVHDYLVHTVTGESFEAIQARKTRHPWGKWMAPREQQGQQVAGGEVTPQAETAGADASPAISHEAHQALAGSAVGVTNSAAAQEQQQQQQQFSGPAHDDSSMALEVTAEARAATPTQEEPPARKRGRPPACAAGMFQAVKPKVSQAQKKQKPAAGERRMTRSSAQAGAAR